MFNFFLGVIIFALFLGVLFTFVYAWLVNYDLEKQKKRINRIEKEMNWLNSILPSGEKNPHIKKNDADTMPRRTVI